MRSFFLVVGLAALLVGCEPAKTPISTTGGTTVGGALPVALAAKMEVACAHCVYKMAGVTSCAPAAKVAGKTLLLSGGGVDMATADICKAPKQATVEGKEEGGKFVATKVEIQK